MKLTSSGPKRDVTDPMSTKVPVVLAKAEGRKVTSVDGVGEIGEVSGSTGVPNLRPRKFSVFNVELGTALESVHFASDRFANGDA